MSKSVWEWLEIEPTQDISAIKSAYAQQVKKYHPEDTPEEFKELQKAYKSAVKLAKMQKSESESESAVWKEVKLENIEQETLKNEPESTIQPAVKHDKNTFDYREAQEESLSEQFFRELENLTMYPYTCNNLEVWKYFFEKEQYQMLYSDADICKKIQDKICSLWGYKRQTLLFFEDWLTKKGTCSFQENKKWKKKKSWIRNIHIVSHKSVTLRPQMQLQKILENQTSSVEEYTEMYLEYAQQNYDMVYKNYHSNKTAFVFFRIGAVVMILFFGMTIMVNVELAQEKKQQSEQQYNQEYIDSLEESVEIQKTGQ